MPPHHNAHAPTMSLGFGLLHYALVRNLRCRRVLVVGSQRGFVPAVCGVACRDQGFGSVDFVDAGYSDPGVLGSQRVPVRHPHPRLQARGLLPGGALLILLRRRGPLLRGGQEGLRVLRPRTGAGRDHVLPRRVRGEVREVGRVRGQEVLGGSQVGGGVRGKVRAAHPAHGRRSRLAQEEVLRAYTLILRTDTIALLRPASNSAAAASSYPSDSTSDTIASQWCGRPAARILS